MWLTTTNLKLSINSENKLIIIESNALAPVKINKDQTLIEHIRLENPEDYIMIAKIYD